MNSIQKKFFGRCLVVVLMVCLFHMNASAADIKFENYRVKSRKGGCVVFVEGNKKLLTIVAQIHMPKGPEGQKHTWKNFSWSRRASIEKQGDLQVIHGKCAYKEDLVTVQADVEMDYRIEVSPEGKLFLFYDFLNKGDEIYMEPHLKITFNYDLLKGQKWAVEKVEGKDKDGVWKEKVVHGMKSISWKTNKYNRIDTRVLSCVLDTRLGKPLKIDLSPETHLRLHGGGRATLYNINNFAGVNTAYDWKRMKKGETFSVEADIDLPVEPSPEKATEAGSKNTPSKKSVVTKKNENINCFAYEDKNKPVRPKIKNGTFYRDGKPVFMVGACKKLVRKPDQFPIEEYRKYPAYTQTIDYGIARKAGFNCLHPRVVPWPIGEQLDPDHPTLSKGFIQWRVDNFPDFIKSLKTLPLVTGYALVCKLSRFTSEDLAQKKGGWHNYVPFCPENPKGKKIYRDFWQYGAKLLLENGGNPWIYELFNEPTYDCRCKYNRQDFVQWLKKKYGGLRNVNRKWGASFQTFEGIIEDTRFERNKGLWVDWLKFIENRWCEILKEGMQAVREVDKRDKVYFSSQRAIIPSFLRTGNGFDEYKTARVLDVVTTEGGIHFSPGGSGAKSDDPFAAHLQGKMRMQLDIARAAAEGKPVIDNEQSTRRFDETGKRIPSKREDLTLMLWNEAIHGSSAVQIFHWHNRAGWWPTPDLEGACKFVNNPNHGWARTCLTNPYNYPKPTLKGIIDFNEEIAKLAEVVLPRPRIKGKIALLLSNPSRRYTRDISKPFTTYYNALESIHYPLDVIYEEQINKGQAKKYEIIISPYSRYIYKETATNLKEYVREGGKVVLQGMDLRYDEYGDPLENDAFLGLKQRMSLPVPVPDKLNMNIPVGESYLNSPETRLWIKVVPAEDSKILAQSQKGIPQIISSRTGRGKVYYIGCRAKGFNLSSLLISILKDANVSKPFTLRSKNGDLLPSVELQLIDRGDKKLYYLVNWKKMSELGILKLNGLQKDQKYYLTDPATDSLYLTPEGNRSWSGNDLKDGIKTFLPGQERVLLLLTKKNPETAKHSLSPKEIVDRYKTRREKDEKAKERLQERRKERYEDYQKRNSYLDAEKEKCFFIDISGKCNMGFKDDVAFDEKGGGFDHGGGNDLRNFTTGKQTFSNVPFRVIEPSQNNGKSIIVLRGRDQDYFPGRVENIPVNRKLKYLYFLHTAAWRGGKFAYVVNYSDGEKKEIPIRDGKEIGGWWKITEDRAVEAKIAWKGANQKCDNIGVYCYRWKNPRKKVKIDSIDIKSYDAGIVPAIIAITGEAE